MIPLTPFIPSRDKILFTVDEDGKDYWQKGESYFKTLLNVRFSPLIYCPPYSIIAAPTLGVELIGYTQEVKPIRIHYPFYQRTLLRNTRNLYTTKPSIFRK